jgi:lysophospholipase L1-like esterase
MTFHNRQSSPGHPGRRRRAALATGILVAALTLGSGSAALAISPHAPQSVIPNGAGPTGTQGLNYVALGDSYSAGYGLTPYSEKPAPGCYQADANYPHLIAAALGMNLTDATCSGAVTANIIDKPQVTAPGVSAPVQSDALSASTDVVTVTIGGNDFGFAPIAASCIALSATGPTVTTYDSCKEFYTVDGHDILAPTIPNIVQPAVKHAFEVIRQKAPNAKIFVIGYPAIAPDVANTPAAGCFSSLIGTGQPPFPQNTYPFTNVDVPYLQNLESQLDAAIHQEADAIGATFIPTFAQTLGNTPCANNANAYINGITLLDDPNDLGVPVTTPGGDPATLPGGFPIKLKLGALHPNEAGVHFLEGKVQAAIAAAFPSAGGDTGSGGTGTAPAGNVVPATDAPQVTVPMLAESGSDPVPSIGLAAFAMLVGAGALGASQARRSRKRS